jgi:uncharacterized protein (TIGR03437 family)
VNKATLKVSANSITRLYGAPNPTLLATITGFQYNDTQTSVLGAAAPTLSTSATAASPVGQYQITPSQGTLPATLTNYAYSFVANPLIVNPAPLTVTASGATRPYDTANSLSYAITGFVNSDTVAVVGGSPSLSTAATLTSPPGTYAVTVSQGTLTTVNYAFTFVNGSLIVMKASATVVLNGVTPGTSANLGQFFTVSMTVTGVSGLPAPSGAIYYTVDGSATVQYAALNNNGAATFSIVGLPAGPHTVLSYYSGDANYLATSASSLTLTVTKFTSQLAVTVAPGTTAAPGQSFALTFSVTGTGSNATPMGTVSCTVDGGAAQSAPLNNSGAAAITIAGLTPGTHTVLCNYGGDGNYLSASASSLTLTVTKIFPVIVITGALGPTAPQGQSVVLTFSVTGTGAAAAATGTMVCQVNSVYEPSVTITAGLGSLTLNGLGVGMYPVFCDYNGDSNYQSVAVGTTVTVQAGIPTINPGGIVSAAGVNSGVAPGSLISLYGTSLEPGSSSGGTNAPSLPLQDILNGVQVLVNGTPAPMLFVSPQQINFLSPYATALGTPVQVAVINNGVTSQPLMVTFNAYAPAVFTYPRTATSIDPIITHADGSLVTPASPPQTGETVVVWATGAGKLNNQPLDGVAAPTSPPATTVDTPTVTVGGVAGTVPYSGLAPTFVGLLQINVQLPATLPAGTGTPPTLPLTITYPGRASTTVNLWVNH